MLKKCLLAVILTTGAVNADKFEFNTIKRDASGNIKDSGQVIPDEKVIIWTANLHASHNLDEAIYKDDDDFYQTFTPLGQRLKSKYGNEVFSIAMISTEGQSAIWNLPTPYPIEIPESSWDYQLSKVIDYDYAFINFRNIANNDQCSQLKFESTILGYHKHTGNWFNIFDGVLYIRKMYRSDKAIEVTQKH